jgi:hypothetical protein
MALGGDGRWPRTRTTRRHMPRPCRRSAPPKADASDRRAPPLLGPRHGGGPRPGLPRATHTGVVPIGHARIPCAVLEDGRRVVSVDGVLQSLGLNRHGDGGRRARVTSAEMTLAQLLGADLLQPVVDTDLVQALKAPLWYRPLVGATRQQGLEARWLPALCDVWRRAAKAASLDRQQRRVAVRAAQLGRGLDAAGLIAAIDATTGYQAERAKSDLLPHLQGYLPPGLWRWTRQLPAAFFQEVTRLHGETCTAAQSQWPQTMAEFLDMALYQPLPPDVRAELQRRAPPPRSAYHGQRRQTSDRLDLGHLPLSHQVAAVWGLMRASNDREDFTQLFRKAFPTVSPGRRRTPVQRLTDRP